MARVRNDPEDEEEDEEEEDLPPIKKKQPVQIVEREINLSLINDKLNFIISIISPKE